jgi:putative phosphonate metabolism protein
MRYALYFAPVADSDLWRFGSSVVGYDAATCHEVAQFVPEGATPAEWHALTGEPRRYGFHATLKAPFRLADGASEASLSKAAAKFAAGVASFDLPLHVTPLDGFTALTPTLVPPELTALEHAVVDTFDTFRAPLTAAELTKRLRTPLTERQRAYLDRHGYPYVHDEFRFHMTLSGRLPEALTPPVIESLKAEFAARCPPSVAIDQLVLFREENDRFRIVARFPFG